jgi:predicted membrane chloride channel (bestrophin family)
MPASLCILHDSRDRLLARRLAADLHAQGISVRADLGEVQAWDVLAARLDEGALTASAGLVLVTPASVTALWLTHELPAERRDGPLHDWRLIVGLQRLRRVPASLAAEPLVDLTDYRTGLAALVAMLGYH